jgi:hypothetical protein
MPAREVDGGYPSEPLAPYIYIYEMLIMRIETPQSGILLGAKGIGGQQ